MFSIADWVILSGGWRRRLTAFCAGAIGALALAPFNFLPAMIVPMTVAVWLIDGAAESKTGIAWRPGFRSASLGNAFRIGWWWGFGYFVAGLWWLGSAFLVQPDDFAWALPLGVVALPAGLAFFPALGFALARLVWAPGASRILALAAGLGFSEWLRGHILSGFPWNAYGMALGDHLLFAQFAAIGGLYGLTVLAIVIFAAPALIADRKAFPSRDSSAAGWRAKVPGGLVFALLLLAGLAAYGGLRLAGGHAGVLASVKVRIMQPNLSQDAKFSPNNGPSILKNYLSLSDRSTGPKHTGLADVNLLVWPESPFPFLLDQEPQALSEIGKALPPGTILVTGAARAEDRRQPDGSHRTVFFNSMQVLTHGGLILDTYDKVHLVPFGEYLPFGKWFDKLGLRQFVDVPGGFEAGHNHTVLSLPGLPDAVPLICYEAIFPEEVARAVKDGASRPGFLINITNDAWFGRTAGPHQHFAEARLRTIEEGLPMVRGGNTGISAIIDPYGRVESKLGLGQEGVVDGLLPKNIPAPPFTRAPVLAGILSWLCALLISLMLRRRV
ncbi:MAG: apolipoprotein N-acyltransferase [Beijerinckiaceae bacterium]|nr:MAG: apolipoprotein N-acyltransferase [Beijerinckiaceae bacterium]